MTTNKEKRKAKKQKARKEQSNKRVITRRNEIRSVAKEKREEQRLEKRIQKLKSSMDEFDIIDQEVYEDLDSKVLSQLEKNVKILQTLEDEWEENDSKRRKMSEALDAQGALTLEDKLRAIHDISIANAEQTTDDVVTDEFIPTESPSVEVLDAEFTKISTDS